MTVTTTMNHGRRWSFTLAVVFNLAAIGMDFTFCASELWKHNATAAIIDSAAAVLFAITLWVVVITERLYRARIAMADAFLVQQQADTALKELMVEQLRTSGRATFEFRAGTTPH